MTGERDGRTNWLVVLLCFCPIFMDGFDATALSLAVPALAAGWGVAPAAFTLPLVATNVGVVLGYLGSGWLARRVGRRRLLIGSTALFSLGTVVTATVLPGESVTVLALVRLFTGLGFGGALPAGAAFATGFSSRRRSGVVSLLVALGFASGATAAGFAYQRLIASVGAPGLFWLAGLASAALLVPLLLFLPPEPAARAGADAGPAERVGRLFEPAVRVNTLLLWAFAFLVFGVSTALTAWVPVLLTDLGFPAADAPLGAAFIYLGAILGGVAVIPLAARLGIGPALVVMPVLGVAFLLTAVGFHPGGALLLAVLGGAGTGISGSQSGQLGLAVALYPPEQRTTGIGWSAAMGRAGSIAGPGAAGLLLGAGVPANTILGLTAVALALAAVCAVLLWRRAADGWKPSTRTVATASEMVAQPIARTGRRTERDGGSGRDRRAASLRWPRT